MQIINKGQNNFLVFTLSEKVTLTNPYYLFSFKHQVLMSSVNFIASDVSGFPTRYNKFLITETTGTVNLTSGVVSLPETGFYEYAIYEQTSSSNLDINNTTGLLEIGMVKVESNLPIYNEYDNQSKTIITYGE
jgi:hypothetical protein